jgi:hypothetical protein
MKEKQRTIDMYEKELSRKFKNNENKGSIRESDYSLTVYFRSLCIASDDPRLRP